MRPRPRPPPVRPNPRRATAASLAALTPSPCRAALLAMALLPTKSYLTSHARLPHDATLGVPPPYGLSLHQRMGLPCLLSQLNPPTPSRRRPHTRASLSRPLRRPHAHQSSRNSPTALPPRGPTPCRCKSLPHTTSSSPLLHGHGEMGEWCRTGKLERTHLLFIEMHAKGDVCNLMGLFETSILFQKINFILPCKLKNS